MLMYSHVKKELMAFVSMGREISCKISEEDWNFLSYSQKQRLLEFLQENPIIDISCMDVTSEKGIEMAEKVRKLNSDTHIILLSDLSVSPAAYIKPSIMAGSILLRPLTKENIKKVFLSAMSDYLSKISKTDEKNFVINTHEGRQLIPISHILFFESREKKIYIVTKNREYPFYDTLDNLENNLSNVFLRCHRSFIVSKLYIKKIFLSQNTIILKNDYSVPLSRTYKNVFKGLK